MLFGPVADALPARTDALLCHTDVEYALFDAVGTFRPPADLGEFGRAFLGRFTRLIGGPAGDDERALSRRMLRAWVDFCTTGDPGWTGVRHWGDEVGARRDPWRGVDLAVPVDHPVRPPA